MISTSIILVYFGKPPLGHTIKTNFIAFQTVNPSLPHFVFDFSRKMFLILYSIKLPNFIVWLLLLREILNKHVLQLFVSQSVMS